MNFDYNEEQQLLADSIRRFIAKDYAFEARKKIVASKDGCSAAVWSTFAEMGLLGIPFAADLGGFGGGAIDLMSVMEAFGEALVVEPYLATIGLGAQFVARGGSDAQKHSILPAVIEGRLKMTFAQTERGARYDLAHVATTAKKAGEAWVIDGEKCVVLAAPLADKLVVSARTSGTPTEANGISLFLVERTAAGVSLRPYVTLDEMRAADVVLKDVEVGVDALLGKQGEGLALIEEVVDFATALSCAEAVGAMKQANDATLEYLKTRKQFGVPIGTFQALQHRMVDMVVAAEQARSMTCLACAKVDREKDARERKRLVSAAKVKIADACRQVSQEAIQLHGGMGMTEELKVSHAFRRLTMIAQQFGDAEHHLERFAALDRS
ncbi:MAG TPA: acyl-CoA dehydrogenase [Burkholderiales bacterium]|nr:acyl-CoA dehydrogenase [Burkholderiales bacterium]